MKREKTGINGVDKMIEGGIPKGSILEIRGPPGVGKSIFALQFLLEGAKKGDKGIYISLEEPRRNIDNLIKEFEFKKLFYELEEKGLIKIKCFTYTEYEKINLELLKKIHENKKIKRIVIDSFNCFFNTLKETKSEYSPNPKKLINESFYYLRKENLNVLLVLEKSENNIENLQGNVPYLVDGIIDLNSINLGKIERKISIPKMRWTNQCKENKNYLINKKGIEITS